MADTGGVTRTGTIRNGDVGVLSAGDVNLEVYISPALGGSDTDIRQFVGEVNIFEDIFKNGLYGNILIIDAASLAAQLPIIGDEYITIRATTPGMKQQIYRTFKVYSMTDRMMIRDTNTQSYILHFCSPELFIDLMTPLYSRYTGTIQDVVNQIWGESVAVPRTGEGGPSPLTIVGNPANNVTFISPGWSALKCVNWLAARALPGDLKAPNFLLYESNKSFYFASIESIINQSKSSGKIFNDYYYMANNISKPSGDAGSPNASNSGADSRYVKDIDNEYKKVEEFRVVETFNAFKNNLNGYYANRLITFDLRNKKYEIFDYDHVSSFDEYTHLENIDGASGVAPFRPDTLRDPAEYITFYPQHDQMYDFVSDNPQDRISEILPRRYSTVQELSNFKIEITVPGRTDIEVGAIVKFHFPDSVVRDPSDKNQGGEDKYYTGYYLVSAIRHKITLQKHMMILELAKDSFHTKA